MTDIKIIPIFNQAAPGIWHDFARIYAATMYTNYNYKTDADDIRDRICKDTADWNKRRAKFAFGAYDGDTMVGYIQGWAQSRAAWVDSLYLMHGYQGTGVGKRLLRSAECAVSHMASYIELISLGGAMNFYESQGYTARTSSNYYRKTLKGPARCDFVPLFHVSASMARACRDINPDFDASLVNVVHMPMFAHFDVEARMDGYIGAAPMDTATPHLRSGTPDFVRKVLQNTFERCRPFYQR